MSWMPSATPCCAAHREPGAVTMTVVPRARDIGGFSVARLLPSARRRSVGPFVFFDQMGPSAFAAGRGLDVRPHPHIGLATVTYLYEGEILHRDSLGTEQLIRAGDVNWMTAGRGIVHSERSPPQVRSQGGRLSGIQSWVALPQGREEAAPAFAHHPAETLPLIEGEGLRLRLIAGALFGRASPVETASETLYADAFLDAGATLRLPDGPEERALFALDAEVEVGGSVHAPGHLLVLRPGVPVAVRAPRATRLLLLGGAPLDGPRHLWWNFVSSTKARIEQAKADWQAGRFAPVPGDDDFIPLPEG